MPKFAELTAEMKELKGKRCWDEHTWTPELQDRFQKIRDLFTDPECRCRSHPMAVGGPGAGENVLITDYSKEGIGAILHQVQYGISRFIGANEQNYHSSVKSENTLVEHW